MMHEIVLKNMFFTTEVITFPDNIFGSNITYLKGKTVRKVTKKIKTDNMNVSKKLIEKKRNVRGI